MSPPDRASRACYAAQAQLNALILDGEPPAEPAETLVAHLDRCPTCARALTQDRALRRALARLRDAECASTGLRDRVRQLLEACRAGRTPRGTEGGFQSS